MNKRKALTLLLSLAILLSLALPAATARADDGGIGEDNGDINEVGTEIDGLEINKTAVYNAETGRYTITLEAYATGASTYITQDIPTDFILVLDQSGSMDDDIGKVQFTEYEDEEDWYYGTIYHTRNQNYYEYRHNGGSSNLWHKLTDGSFVSVSVTKTQKFTPLDTNLPNYSYRNDCYYDYANNLYEKVGEEYKKVSLTYEYQGRPVWDKVYTYTFNDGTTVSSTGDSSSPNLGSHAPLYTPAADGNDTVYTYTYTDSAGAVQAIGTSTGASTRFTPAFYKRSISTSGGGSRLNALKNAATTFANAVAAKAAGADGDITTTADNIDHRIAVVGYADTDWDYGYNTGVFIGSTLNRYETAAAGVYGTALQDMSTTAGKNNVTASINALQASGATRTDYGLTMANGILNANPVPEGETRNRIVIVFTDGSPTDSNGFELNVANAAINNANAIKDSGATVYSIGIFPGADATSAGNQNGNETEKANWFMQQVSSNNGTPRSPSYYLSASDAGTLNSIFHQISQQIQTGGSNTELSGTAVVKDIVSPYFTLPAGASASSITLETYRYHGPNKEWTNNNNAMGARATVTGKEVSVTNFDFAKNWCGTETDAEGNNTIHEGNKLVIRFDVTPEPGFLGGNDVPTNNTSAGIYKEGETEPSKRFPVPHVNVPIKDIAVTAENKNVYLLGEVTLDQLKSGSTITVGAKEGVSEGIKLDLSKDNYGLEAWQTEYVTITVAVKDAADKEVTDKIGSLTGETNYTIEVTIAPTTTGTTTDEKGPAAESKSGKAEAKINVFKPELTYKDSEAYYGDNAPTDYIGNLVSEVWKHGDTIANPGTMIGAAPELTKEYTPEAGKISTDNKINTKQDIGVDVTVKINNEDVTGHVKFEHTNCTGKTCNLPEGKKFLIHVKTCTLTITKTGGTDNESYVFDVYKDGIKYSEVAIWGNSSQVIYELPVGTYTIEENTGWSWRYTPSYSGAVTLNMQTHDGTITCTNAHGDNYKWLNGFSTIVRNILDFTSTPATDTTGNN